MDKVSVAIICMNEEEVLPVTLECLVPIADIISEVVIVDGWSLDGTHAVISSFMDRLPIVTIRRQFDTFKDQKNVALSWCRGDWVLGLDADMAFNSLLFGDIFTKGDFFPKSKVWDFALYYCKGDMRNYDIGSTTSMPTTRLWRNIGLRYERDVHEYLVFPGETGWDSIHNSGRLRNTDKIAILETSELKSSSGLRARVARYAAWADKSADAGIHIDQMARNTEDIIADRWKGTRPIPDYVLAGVPSACFDYPLSKGELK